MNVAFIDHYDSFSFNVIDWLSTGKTPVTVNYIACDDEAGLAALAARPQPVVLSPGPKRPEDQPATLALARQLLGRVPILGVCLGHQMLAVLGGGQIVRSRAVFHGTTRRISPVAPGPSLLFKGLEGGFDAAVYNSLVATGELGAGWRVTATCEHGEVQALERIVLGEAPAFGVQFHPESFLSEGAAQLRENWLAAL